MFCWFKIQKRYYITIFFQKKFDESNIKPNKIWVDKGAVIFLIGQRNRGSRKMI